MTLDFSLISILLKLQHADLYIWLQCIPLIRSDSQTNKELNFQHTMSKDFKIFSFLAMPVCRSIVRKEKKTLCLWFGSEVSQTYFLYNFLSRPTEALHRSLLSISHMNFFKLLRALFFSFPFVTVMPQCLMGCTV